MGIRVAHLTSVHAADDTRVFVKECRTLAAAGYDVSLIAPGAVQGDVDGVHMVPVPRRKTRLGRATRTAWAVYREAIRLEARICHFHDPELIPIGLLLKLRGRCVIYDVHEDFPRQIATKDWINPLVRRPVSAVAAVAEWIASRVFDATVCTTPATARRFPRGRTYLVRNYPIKDEAVVARGRTKYEDRPESVVFVGGLTPERGALEIVTAMERLRSRQGVVLYIAGQLYPDGLEAALRSLPGWSHVEFLGWLDREAVAELLDTARVGVITYLPVPHHVGSNPNKLFEYMGAGIPVIASDFPIWREIVTESRSGLLVDPANPTAIAQAIDYMLDNPEEAAAMGASGRRAVETRFNWEAERVMLLRVYERVLGARGRAT